jgi:ribosomal protein S18 acetylase RimI-like enzyme
MEIRTATHLDDDAIWNILAPIVRAGDTYALPREMGPDDALAYWFAAGHEVFVATNGADVVGTYFMQPNHQGGGSHVANCGYATAPSAAGRGIGRAMCEHSLVHATAKGYRAMQFNFVVSTNERAVRLWEACGFEIVGRLPRAFHHPSHGDVDAFVMFRTLADRRR